MFFITLKGHYRNEFSSEKCGEAGCWTDKYDYKSREMECEL